MIQMALINSCQEEPAIISRSTIKRQILFTLFLLFFVVSSNFLSKDVRAESAPANTQVILDEATVHTIQEVITLIRNYIRLILRDPILGFSELSKFIGGFLGARDPGDGIAGDIPIPGPGLGNIEYSEDEVFKPVGWVNQDNGLPGIYSKRKPFGTNLGMMLDGYFFTLFAPDSGKGPGGFLFLDVSNPKDPKLIRRIYEPETRTKHFREPHSYGLARINGRRYMVFQNIVGIEIWDFTDLNQLEKVSELDLPNVDAGDYSNVSWQLTFQAPYLYVASAEQGIFIVDVHDPLNPQLAIRSNGGANPIPISQLGGFSVGPINAFGNQLVISSMENKNGFASLDISDPLNPQILDLIPAWPQLYYASCYDGEYFALSVRGSQGLMALFDLNDPANFNLHDDDLSVPGQLYCAFQDDFVFQGTEDYVVKVDISNPAEPFIVGQGTLTSELVRIVDHGQVSPMGNLVFVGNDHGTGSAFVPHQNTPDHLPPHLKTTNPKDGAVNQSTLSRIALAFSDVIDFNSVNENTIQVTNAQGQAITGVFSAQNNIVHFAPSETLQPNSLYRVHVSAGGVRDLVGNAVVANSHWSFTTGAGDGRLNIELEFSAETQQAVSYLDAAEFSVLQESIHPSRDDLEFAWVFGDGQRSEFSADPSVTHQYDVPGHYQVNLLVRAGDISTQFSFTKTIINPPAVLPPVQSATLVVAGNLVFTANTDNRSVSAMDLASGVLIWETGLNGKPQSISVGENNQLWLPLLDVDQIQVVNPDGTLAQTIDLDFGTGPRDLLFAPDKSFVLLSQSNNRISKLAASGEVVASLDFIEPRAIAITGDGRTGFVSRFISTASEANVAQLDLASFTIRSIDTITADTTTVDSQDRARGVANYLFDLALDPSATELSIVAKKDNVFRGEFRDGQTLDHDSTVRAVLHTRKLISPPAFVDQSNSTELDFDNGASPRAVIYSVLGDYIFTALQGSNRVIVTDAYTGSRVLTIETELAPQGLVLVDDLLVIHNFLSRSVSVYDVADVLQSKQFSVTHVGNYPTVSAEQLAPNILLGKQIFYNADDPRMSQESYISCASCHVEGGQDGMVWDFSERGEGLRNTIALTGRGGMAHGNVHWTANFDEIQDFENDIRNGFGGVGFLSDGAFSATEDPLGVEKEGLNADLDALSSYVSSLTEFSRSPYQTASEKELGREIFLSLNCTQCHTGENFTDGLRHDVGTLIEGSGLGIGEPLAGLGIETPTLRGLWNSAPYLHHGQAATVEAVLQIPEHGNAESLSTQDLAALIIYLKSL